jgi:hypothetical protein
LANFLTSIARAKIRAEAAAVQPFASAGADEISIRMEPFLDLRNECEATMSTTKKAKQKRKTKKQNKKAKQKSKRKLAQQSSSRDTEIEHTPS